MNMTVLKNHVQENDAITRPAEQSSIDTLQSNLGFFLSDEYKEYLKVFGVITHGAYETYGLGVPDDYFQNVYVAYKDLSSDTNYPNNALPLLELGDGHYYLYDNKKKCVLLWAMPRGGIVRYIDGNLESFLIQHIFSQ